MGYRLTPQERRIMRQTQREGEELYASQTDRQKNWRTVRSAAVWIAVLFLFVIGAAFFYYLGTIL